MTKKKLKKQKKIFSIVLGVFIATFLVIGIFVLSKYLTIKKYQKMDIQNNNVLNYLTIDNKQIYLYNLKELHLKYNNRYITLQDYFKEHNNNIEETFKNLEKYLKVRKTLYDGGTTIYESKNYQFFLNHIIVIKCHTNDGNEDIYFGVDFDTTEAFKNGACGKNFFDDREFTRTYTITNVKKVKEALYDITITDGKKEITIERSLSQESRSILKENQEFIFYFTNKYGELIKEDIEEIFNNCTLTGVVPKES